jgi:hypothetical protein
VSILRVPIWATSMQGPHADDMQHELEVAELLDRALELGTP